MSKYKNPEDLFISFVARVLVLVIFAVCSWSWWMLTTRPAEPYEFEIVTAYAHNSRKIRTPIFVCVQVATGILYECDGEVSRVGPMRGKPPEGTRLTGAESKEEWVWVDTFYCIDAYHGSLYTCTIGENPRLVEPVRFPERHEFVDAYSFRTGVWGEYQLVYVLRNKDTRDYLKYWPVTGQTQKIEGIPEDTRVVAVYNSSQYGDSPVFYGPRGKIK